jgi:chromobox protein 1
MLSHNILEVEKIIGKRVWKGKVEYLTKWKGYSDSEVTWEKASIFSSQLIDEYER